MPDLEKLLDVWPEEFEIALSKMKLPSPDLDLTLTEYSKLLCSIIDIPTYDNPIESLHHLFSLYMAFRDNPHFQVQAKKSDRDDVYDRGGVNNYGGADVMQITQGLK